MLNRRRAMLMAAVCSTSLVAVSAVQAETLVGTLTDAYKNNPALQQARATQRNSDELYYQTLVQQLGPGPLTLTVGQSVSSNSINTSQGISPATFSGLSLSQRLTTGGLTNRALTRNEIALFRARDTLRQTEQTQMQTVISDYIAVLSGKLNVDIQRAGLTTAQRSLDNFQAQYDVGVVILTAVAQQRVALFSAQQRLQTAQNTLAAAKNRYAIDVGHIPDDNFEAPPDLPNVPATYDDAIQLAFQWSQTWRNAVYADRLAELTLADAKTKPLPTASATVGYSLGTGEIRTGAVRDLANRDNLTAALSLSIPLYSFGLNSSTLRVARETREQARLTLKTARDNLVLNIQNQWNSLVNTRNSLEITKVTLENQTVATRGQRVQQVLGNISITDLLVAEDNLRSTQQQLVTARTSLYNAEAALLLQIGLLDPRYLIPNVTPFDPLENFERLKSKFVIVPYAPVLTAVDSLFSPKLDEPPAGAELPAAKVDVATVVPPLSTMAAAPAQATKDAYVIQLVPDLPPPAPAMIPLPEFPPMDISNLQDQGRGPPAAAGGRGGGGGGGFGGGGR